MFDNLLLVKTKSSQITKIFLASSTIANYNITTAERKVGVMFTKKLADLRKLKSMTLEEVGNIVGAEKQTVWGWERGKSKPPYETLVKLACLFETSTDYLLGMTDDRIQKAKHIAEIMDDRKSSDSEKLYRRMIVAGYSPEQIEEFIDLAVKLTKNRPS